MTPDERSSMDHTGPDHPMTLRQAAEFVEKSINSGKCDQVEEICRRALMVVPDDPMFTHFLGVALAMRGRVEDGLAQLRKAVKVAPDYAEALQNLGGMLFNAGDFGEAVEVFNRLLQIKPNCPEALCFMGKSLWKAGQKDEAVAAWRRVVALRPDSARDHANLGEALLDRAKLSRSPDQPCCDNDYFAALDEAAQAYRHCLDLNPQLAGGYRGLGHLAWLRGSNKEMLYHYDRALAIEPQDAESHYDRAVALLARGNYAKGWQEFEWRWKRVDTARHKPTCAQPLWDGSDLGGKRIMLHGEQGHGDMIQFARFAPMVADRGGQVILQCAAHTERLFRSLRGVRETVIRNTVPARFDVYYPLMSLPLIFRTTLETIPCQIPYLHADTADVEIWRRRLGEKKSFRVGIAWAGSTNFSNDWSRSCSLRQLAPLLAVGGTSFYSLQVDRPSETLDQLADMGVVDMSPHLTDFAQTAAALTQLDLVISVDTSVVHLAGAMGRPVWAMLAFESDWRWLENRQDSPWYPTARLFRQDTPGNWQGLIQEVARALGAEVENHRAASQQEQ